MNDQDVLLMMQQGHLSSDVLRKYREGILNSELMRAVKVFLASNPLYADAAEGVEEFEDEAALEASLQLLEKSREKLLKGRSNVSYLRFEWIQRAALLAAAVAMIGITTFVIQRFTYEQKRRATFADLKRGESRVSVATQDTDALRQAQRFEQHPLAAGKTAPQASPATPYTDGMAPNEKVFAETYNAAPAMQNNQISVVPVSPLRSSPAAAGKPTAPPAPAMQQPQAPVQEQYGEVYLQEMDAADDADIERNAQDRPIRAMTRQEAKEEVMLSEPSSAPASAGVTTSGTNDQYQGGAIAPAPESPANLLARAEQFLTKQDTVSAIPLLERAAKLKGPEAKKAAERLKKVKKK